MYRIKVRYRVHANNANIMPQLLQYCTVSNITEGSHYLYLQRCTQDVILILKWSAMLQYHCIPLYIKHQYCNTIINMILLTLYIYINISKHSFYDPQPFVIKSDHYSKQSNNGLQCTTILTIHVHCIGSTMFYHNV